MKSSQSEDPGGTYERPHLHTGGWTSGDYRQEDVEGRVDPVAGIHPPRRDRQEANLSDTRRRRAVGNHD
jgi:hypothetical protein